MGWAERIGFNAPRVNLHAFAWEADRQGMLERLDRFLAIASAHGIRTMCCRIR